MQPPAPSPRAPRAPAPYLPLEIELERDGRRVRYVLAALVLFVAFSIGVLSIAPIRGVIVGVGTVKPSGEAVALHHERGGPVAEILVERGARVAAEAPILRLRAEPIESERAQLDTRRAHIDLEIERLLALIDGREPEYPQAQVRLGAGVLANELQRFESDRTAYQIQLDTFATQLESRRVDAGARAREADSIGRELAALNERREILDRLVGFGIATRTDQLDLAARIAETDSRHAAVLGQFEAAERAAIEIEQEQRHFVARQRAEWSTELAARLVEADELAEQARRTVDALARLTVRAPVAGVVKVLGAGARDAVIAPGGLVAEIVPVGRELIAEIRLSPNDIGHVRLGDAAKVRIGSFDPELYGEVAGEVVRISPTSFANEQGETYYTAELRLTPPPPGANPKQIELMPGMTLTASILGSQRSVLGYLAKPFRRTVETAFTEG